MFPNFLYATLLLEFISGNNASSCTVVLKMLKCSVYDIRLLGQSPAPQSCSSVLDPTQSLPPFLAGIFPRVRVCFPPPHDFVQVVHAFQLSHLQLTALENYFLNTDFMR